MSHKVLQRDGWWSYSYNHTHIYKVFIETEWYFVSLLNYFYLLFFNLTFISLNGALYLLFWVTDDCYNYKPFI